MICRSWDVFLVLHFSFVFVGVDSLTELPPPTNLALSWEHCSMTARWGQPAGLDPGCTVNYTVILESKTKDSPNTTTRRDSRQTVELSYKWFISNENELCINIMTNPFDCKNKTKSMRVQKCISPPAALVENFTCVHYSNKKVNCSWTSLSNTSNLEFHYSEISSRTLSRSFHSEDGLMYSKHCTSYITNGPQKTGCHINSLQSAVPMCFIINSTTENLTTLNSFVKEPSVKPLPPKLHIVRNGDYLNFQSSLPGFLNEQCWLYIFAYSKCKEEVKEMEIRNWSVVVPYDEACKYKVQVRTKYSDYCGTGASDWSEPQYYGEDVDLNWPLKVIVIIVPVFVACCLIVVLVLFKRHKDIIFPAIPQPSLLVKDMLNGNNDGLSKNIGVGKLYVPIKEVVEKDVSLEIKSALLLPAQKSTHCWIPDNV